MKRILKKISALALAAALLMGVVPGQTAAAFSGDTDSRIFKRIQWFYPDDGWFSPTPISGEKYDLGVENRVLYDYDEASETLTISGKGWTQNYYYEGCIPEDVDWETYHPMRTPWDDYADKAKKIVIEDGITAVGLYNFNEFTALECVEFADSVEWVTAITLPYASRAEVTLVGKPGSIVEAYAYAFGYNYAPSEEMKVQGDLDGSGYVTPDDALMMLEMIAGKRDLYGYSGDINGDGRLTSDDALYVLKRVAGKL